MVKYFEILEMCHFLKIPGTNNRCIKIPGTNNCCIKIPGTKNHCIKIPGTNNRCIKIPDFFINFPVKCEVYKS